MAHECASCGSECYCNGDIDDAVVSLTPGNCRGCGSDLCDKDETDFDRDDEWDYDDDCEGTPWVICTCGAYAKRKDGTQAKVADCICDSYTVYI